MKADLKNIARKVVAFMFLCLHVVVSSSVVPFAGYSSED